MERPGACANSCVLGPPRSASPWNDGRGPGEQSAQERRGKGHAARRESRVGSERAGPPPSYPTRKAKSPRRARRAGAGRSGPGRGLLQGGPGTARSPAGRSSPRPPGTGPSAAATRRATLRARGHRGRYYLEGSAPLVKAPPGQSGVYVFGARGCLSWTPPLPSLPFSAVGLLLSTPSCGVELRYLIILLHLLPAPAELLCLSHRFPVGHVVARERDGLAVGRRLFVVREKSRARGGQGRDVGRRFQVCECGVPLCGEPAATSPEGCAPDCAEGGGERGLYRDWGWGLGWGGARPTASAGYRARILTY